SQLFTAAGPAAIEAARKRGFRVFLDLKFHDIPNTVAAAVREATRFGIFMLNIHASGGLAMARAAAEAAVKAAGDFGIPRPLCLGVTVLTSLDRKALQREVGVPTSVEAHVPRLAGPAFRTGGTPLAQRTIRSGSRRRGGRSPPAPTTWSWGGRSPVLRTRPRPRPPSSPSSAGHDRPRDARSLRDNRRPAARPLPADLGPPLGRLSPVGARPAAPRPRRIPRRSAGGGVSGRPRPDGAGPGDRRHPGLPRGRTLARRTRALHRARG